MPVTNNPQQNATQTPDNNPLMLPAQAAEHLNVTERKLQLDRSTKREIPFIKIGHHVRYRKSDLDDYIESCKVGGVA